MIRAIVGANWGDEGKGKITDLFSAKSDIVIRFQGGSNAGHTIINDFGKFALHQLPSGVFYEHTTNIIGNGVALNIPEFINEVNYLIENGVPKPKILVSERAQVVMPYHILFDKYEEERLSSKQFGSTKSGIAPFYSDKYAKTGIQICDLFDIDGVKDKLESVIEYKNVLLKELYNKPTIDFSQLLDTLSDYRNMIEPYVVNTFNFVREAVINDKNITLEGQLGALKDTDFGIYPFVTSSHTLAGFASIGAGIAPHKIKNIICVAKAYSSAVGAGAFVSEIFGDDANMLRKRGGDAGEYGATTGRPRRMGWFDCVATRYGCNVQGATEVALTAIDVLEYLDEIPVCVSYDIEGELTNEFPVTHRLNKAKPVIKNLPGFKGCNIRGINKYSNLPDNAKKYISFIEEQLQIPVTLISTGPNRDEVILLDDR